MIQGLICWVPRVKNISKSFLSFLLHLYLTITHNSLWDYKSLCWGPDENQGIQHPPPCPCPQCQGLLWKAVKLGRQNIPLVNPFWLPLVTFSSFMCFKIASQNICSRIFPRTEATSTLDGNTCLLPGIRNFPSLPEPVKEDRNQHQAVPLAATSAGPLCEMMDLCTSVGWRDPQLFFLRVPTDCNWRLRNSGGLRRSLTCEIWGANYLFFPVACH